SYIDEKREVWDRQIVKGGEKEMLKTIRTIGILLLSLFLLAACGQAMSSGNLNKVGLLVTDTVNDQVWGTKGYRGMLKIQSDYNVDVYYKEGMNSELIVEQAVE